MGAISGSILPERVGNQVIDFLDNCSTATVVGENANDIANIADADLALANPNAYQGHCVFLDYSEHTFLPGQYHVIDHINWLKK